MCGGEGGGEVNESHTASKLVENYGLNTTRAAFGSPVTSIGGGGGGTILFRLMPVRFHGNKTLCLVYLDLLHRL